MYSTDLLYQIALTLVPNIGDVHAKSLIIHYGNAQAIFKAPQKDLEKIDGIGTIRANSIKSFSDFSRCEAEISFIEKYNIKALFITDEAFPKRLINCYDSPVLLYYKGNANLNHSKIVAVVGTRKNSPYGKTITEKLIEDLTDENILIVSGLAYGIDTIAHQQALKHNIPTVGVMAHGLDMIYPAQNKTLAKHMIEQGGILTDFMSGTIPDKQNFPSRNRIVAGICDAIVVIESSKTGGSLITATLGNSYHKDVFAFPGRVNDLKSEGCHLLIRQNKASLISSAADLIDMMLWNRVSLQPKKLQRSLFIELNEDEQKITAILSEKSSVHIDEIYIKSGFSSSFTAGILLTLEMRQVIRSLPGKLYQLIN